MTENNQDSGWNERLMLGPQSVSLLGIVAGWAKFLAGVGFVFIALMAIIVVSAGVMLSGVTRVSDMSGMAHIYPYNPGIFNWFHNGLCLLVPVVCIFPLLFLFRFASKVKKAIDGADSQMLESALRDLRSHYMIVGILTVLWLVSFVATITFFMVSVLPFM